MPDTETSPFGGHSPSTAVSCTDVAEEPGAARPVDTCQACNSCTRPGPGSVGAGWGGGGEAKEQLPWRTRGDNGCLSVTESSLSVARPLPISSLQLVASTDAQMMPCYIFSQINSTGHTATSDHAIELHPPVLRGIAQCFIGDLVCQFDMTPPPFGPV